jgi:hypothetical protein
MNWLSSFLPTTLIIAFLLYAFVHHEVSEWAYERDQGLQGSSASFGLLVDATAAIGSIGLYVLLTALQDFPFNALRGRALAGPWPALERLFIVSTRMSAQGIVAGQLVGTSPTHINDG